MPRASAPPPSEINAHLSRDSGGPIHPPPRTSLRWVLCPRTVPPGLPRQHPPVQPEELPSPLGATEGGNPLQLLEEAWRPVRKHPRLSSPESLALGAAQTLSGKARVPAQALGGVAAASRAVPGPLSPGQRPHKVVLGRTETPLRSLASPRAAETVEQLPLACAMGG